VLYVEDAIRRIQVNQNDLKLNGTNQFLVLLMMLKYWDEVFTLNRRGQKLC
jgi:hypothetical protein